MRRALVVVPLVLSLSLLFAGAGALMFRAALSGSPADLLQQVLAPPTVIRPDPAVVLGQVRALARLETASVTLQTTVHAGRGEDVLGGLLKETLLFVAHGDAVAGVDLSALSDGDIRVDDTGVALVRLPPAELFAVDVDERRSFVADRDWGWLASVDPHLETEARRAAERSLRDEALRLDLLDAARANAEHVVEDLLRGAGATGVVFL